MKQKWLPCICCNWTKIFFMIWTLWEYWFVCCGISSKVWVNIFAHLSVAFSNLHKSADQHRILLLYSARTAFGKTETLNLFCPVTELDTILNRDFTSAWFYKFKVCLYMKQRSKYFQTILLMPVGINLRQTITKWITLPIAISITTHSYTSLDQSIILPIKNLCLYEYV